jgi:hypothetical protein
MSLTALALIGALQVVEQPPIRVPVTELLGRTPAEVAARIGAPGEVSVAEAVRIVDGGRAVDIYPAQRFHRAWPEGGVCVTGFPEVPLEGEPDANPRAELIRRSRGWFVFENGRLVGVRPAAPVARRPEDSALATREATHARMMGPQPLSPMTVAPGRLPLSDGLGVLERLPAALADLSLTSLCVQLPERTVRSGDVGTDIIWAMVGLTVLPFVPFQKAEESRADREGGALLDAVEPGSILPGGVEGFVGRRRGVRVYRDTVDPGFAVIGVKLGNGADNIPDIGLLGVRDDRVVWEVRREAGQQGVGPLVCRDAENRPSGERPGCSDYGFLRP